MRALIQKAIFLSLLALAIPAQAAERGLVLRDASIMAQPFIDAARNTQVIANQPVTILARKGGWVQVDAAGKQGWLRVLNLRLAVPAGGVTTTKTPGAYNPLNSVAALYTGSSARTVTTGVKGMDIIDIRKATPDPAQLARLDALAATNVDARAYAAKSQLVETQADYLIKAGSK